MKKIIFSIIAATAVLSMASCTKEETSTLGSNEIRFNMGYPGAVTKASASGFTEGDEVSLYAVERQNGVQMPLQIGGNYINNAKITLTNGTWTPASTLLWSENPCDFYAIYPYQKSISTIDSYLFSIKTDQSTEANEVASDLLFASAENVSRSDAGVSLAFNHMMSKCVVNIIKGTDFEGTIPDNIVTHIYNTVTEAKVDWTSGSLEKSPTGSHNTITMYKNSNTQFEAIVVPQNIENRTPLIEITMNGIAYLLEAQLSFRPGYIHTFNVTLNSSPEQEYIEINIDPTVTSMN